MPDIAKDKEPVKAFIIYRFDENEETNIENPAKILQIVPLQNGLNFVDKTLLLNKKYTYVVTAIDQLQNESLPSDEISFKLTSFTK